MMICNRRYVVSPNLVLNNTVLEQQTPVKFLGLHLDSKLNYSNHIKVICSKISKSIGILYRVNKFVPPHCLKILYSTMILPYLQYCICIWGGTSACHLEPLIVLQKRAVRILSGASYYAHTNPLFHKNSILKLGDLYTYNLAIFMYKNRHLLDLGSTHDHMTRNRNALNPPWQRLTSTQQAIPYRGSLIWNGLPQEIRDRPSLPSFKRGLKLKLINSYNT